MGAERGRTQFSLVYCILTILAGEDHQHNLENDFNFVQSCLEHFLARKQVFKKIRLETAFPHSLFLKIG